MMTDSRQLLSRHALDTLPCSLKRWVAVLRSSAMYLAWGVKLGWWCLF